ncbi:hypothetical protein GCM10017687_87720 [Streptomyces echinatus]|uniref:hypothetical protein n=1 Tax=Streptomyces echinatus TaxID=67293 RepID=UPI0031EBCCDC
MTQPVSPHRGHRRQDRAGTAGPPPGAHLSARADVRTLSLLGVLAALVVIGGVTKPDEFLDTRNLQLVLTQASVIGSGHRRHDLRHHLRRHRPLGRRHRGPRLVWATTVATQEYVSRASCSPRWSSASAADWSTACSSLRRDGSLIATLAMLASARGLALQITDGKTQIVTIDSVLRLGERDSMCSGPRRWSSCSRS